MKARSVPSIVLKISNNIRGNNFTSLYPSKRSHGCKWDVFPIYEHTIERVEQLEEDEKQNITNQGMPCFEWTPGAQIEDETNAEYE